MSDLLPAVSVRGNPRHPFFHPRPRSRLVSRPRFFSAPLLERNPPISRRGSTTDTFQICQLLAIKCVINVAGGSIERWSLLINHRFLYVTINNEEFIEKWRIIKKQNFDGKLFYLLLNIINIK